MTEQETGTSKFQEIVEEFRTVFAGRGRVGDSLVPPIIFLILNAVLDFEIAVWGSLGVAVIISAFRAYNRQPIRYAIGGIGGVLFAIIIARLVGRTEGFFLPGIISAIVTIVLCLVSVIVKRPLVAWTSFIARRWPLDWYWHPKVRPAYNEVTIAWAVFFTLRLLPQLQFYQREETSALGVTQLITGWPGTVVLLILSYLYGIWRLQNLEGPSVEEFKAHVEPPWEGQRRGF